MARITAALMAGISFVAAAPAWAGEEVLYGPPAAWVVPADIAAARAANRPIVLLDRQVRLEQGSESGFSDIALRIDSPEALNAVSTPTLSWQPDKGDLTIHRLEILRGTEVIDLLAGGARFSVLRRETGLENRSIDGALTATLAVPGLKVGDILRYSQTITLRDQALGDDVQAVERLMPRPAQMGLGRIIVSWPQGEDYQWRITRGAQAEPVLRDGYRVLTINQPMPELPPQPEDAPGRFSVPPLVQVGSFGSWEDVSARMAPLFATQGKITPGGPVDQQVQAIMRKSADPLERAALVLRLVQDEVSYLLNGMNGGNYIPQEPEFTWQARYGDCKAKTMLLLAMLRAMDITAEAALVHSEQGDAVPGLLPMPADFDHVIVRADIGGKEYWLDGTSGGTRLATIAEVPGFEHALPLRPQGAGLMTMAQRWQDVPDRVLRFTYDLGAGIGMPVLFDGEVELTGIMATRVRSQVAEREQANVMEFARAYVKDMFPDSIITTASVAYDDDSGVGRIALSGMMFGQWELGGAEAKYVPVLASTGFEFKPDRSRSSWRDIPVQLSGPTRFREEATILLPDGGTGFTLDGVRDFAGEVAGQRIQRSMAQSGASVTIIDDASKLPVEIAPADFAAQRAAATRLAGGDPVVKAGRDARRNWQLAPAELRMRFRPLERMLADVIAEKPEEAWRHAMRGALRAEAYDREGAVADLSRAITLGATAEYYAARAGVYQALGKIALAMADARSAYDLQPDAASAIYLAQVEADAGDPAAALALLDGVEAAGDDRIGLMQVRAELSGQAGLLEQGWTILEDAVAQRPGSNELLNSQCWYAATWQHRLDEAEGICTRAVEASQWAAATLDSRALAYYRLGRRAEALADLEAALRNTPDQAPSRYLRGIIRTEMGDQAGRQDIADALRQAPSVSRIYGRYGVMPPG